MNFVKCTNNYDGSEVYINLAHVESIQKLPNGATRVWVHGGENSYYEVKESAEQILTRLPIY